MAVKRSQIRGDFAVTVAIGVLVSLLVSVVPTVSVAVIVTALAVAIASPFRADRRRGVQAAGVLVGSGAFYLYGAINTTLACLDNRCGNGNPLPLLLFALLSVGVGVATGASLITARRP